MIDQIKPLLGKLCAFSKERMGFSNPPKLFLKTDKQNSTQMLGKTAQYDPERQSITLFVHGRHPKDILRSFAHELVHHAQNLRGDLDPQKMGAMGSNYAQDNKHMRNMEKEAYLKGNMCFRDWEDTIEDKDKFLIKLAESKFLKENKTMTKKITKEFLKESIRKILKEQEMAVGPGLPDTMEPDLVAKPTLKQLIKQKQEEAMMTIEDAIAELKAELEAMEMQVNQPGDPEIEEGSCSKRNDDIDEAAKMPDKNRDGVPDYAQDGKGPNDLGKADGADSEEDKEKDDSDKKDDDDDKDGDLSKVPPQLRKHVKGKMDEFKIQTPEQENTLYEQRFTPKNNRLFEKLVKEWTK